MVRVRASEIINRPSADVFRFVATDHFENHPKWDPSIVEIEQTSVRRRARDCQRVNEMDGKPDRLPGGGLNGSAARLQLTRNVVQAPVQPQSS